MKELHKNFESAFAHPVYENRNFCAPTHFWRLKALPLPLMIENKLLEEQTLNKR